jgi:hypothetical protein
MKTNAPLTPEEFALAEQYIAGANEKIKTGSLVINGVTIKALSTGTVMSVFHPGDHELVRRYFRGW